MTDNNLISVEFADEFHKQLRKLSKKYRHIKKGKSAGYRVLYFLKTEAKIVLLTIYSKSNQVDISATEISNILRETYEK